MEGPVEVELDDEVELDAVGQVAAATAGGWCAHAVVATVYARVLGMIADLVDQVLGLELLGADAVDRREQGKLVRRVAALEHAVDLLGRRRALELLAVQHRVLQLLDRLHRG